MAVLGSIGTAVYRHGVPQDAPAAAQETLGGALTVAAGLPGRAGDALATAARGAFTDGMRGAAAAGTLLLLGAAVLAARGLRNIRVRPETAAQDAESAGHADSLSTSGA